MTFRKLEKALGLDKAVLHRARPMNFRMRILLSY